MTDILIQNNLLAGGGYTLGLQKATNADNLQVTNNRFSTIFVPTCGRLRPQGWVPLECGRVVGNVYYETGLPLG